MSEATTLAEAVTGNRRAPTVRERFGTMVFASRHPIRMVAMALAALALCFGIAGEAGLFGAMAGAVLGVLGGELLGRSQLRLVVLIGVSVALLALGWWFCGVMTATTLFPTMLGPATALVLASALRFFLLALATTLILRTLGTRFKPLVGLELALVAACIAAMFSAHRDGVIARPLWLSDWAWQRGYDPVEVFLTVGAVAVVMLAGLLIVESERNVTLVTLLSLPLLALLAVTFVSVENLPKPEPTNELGLTEHEVGDPPNPTPPDGYGPGAEGQPKDPKQGQGGGQGQQQQQQQQQGGGGQGEQQQQQQQGGGQGQQQQQQGGGQGQQQQQQQGGGQGQQQQQQQQPDLENQQVSPGQAPAPMAVVLLGDDYSPPTQAFYFRQDVWSHFNGNRLVAAQRPDVDLDIIRRFPAREIETKDHPAEEGFTRVHATVALLVKHAQPFALETTVKMSPEPNPDPSRFIRAYNFESLAPSYDLTELFDREPGNPDWDPTVWDHYLTVPQDARYFDLAKEVVEAAELPEARKADPFAQALVIKLWMDENLIYKTAEKHAGVPDPAADFLFGNRTGYCVHFAHAAVYMWRTLGIPARVGTGYHVEEDKRRGSTILIRGGDAHAWPELYLEGIGWVILDISAAENQDPQGEAADDDLTEMFGELARKKGKDDQDETPEDTPERRSFGADIAFGFLLLGLATMVFLYVAKLWRRIAPRLAGVEKMPKVGYRFALDLLSEAGATREFGETREAFARRLEQDYPSLPELTSMNVAARLGNPDAPLSTRRELDRARWRQYLAQLRAERSRAAPLWRRLLGVLDPTSFLRAR